MKKSVKTRTRPLGVREQRRLQKELAKLAAMSSIVFQESVRIEVTTLGDAANLLRTTCGTVQAAIEQMRRMSETYGQALYAAIGQMQRMADACERVQAEVKRNALDPHDGFARSLTALAKQVSPS